jgi:hypothetical protein
MKRRALLVFGALSPVALFAARLLGVKAGKADMPLDYRQRAEELDQLASSIQSPADARQFVDFVADLFEKETPSGWTRGSVRTLVAEAEFAAVSDAQKGIPEARVAEAWNGFVETIQAAEDQKVTAAEIHNLRDAFLTTSRIAWKRWSRNIWAVPSIYNALPGGELAPGCRAVESIRVLWDLANTPGNVKAARERVREGVLMSDLYRKELEAPAPSGTRGGMVMGHVRSAYPIETAQREYVRLKGERAFRRAVMDMVRTTLS